MPMFHIEIDVGNMPSVTFEEEFCMEADSIDDVIEKYNEFKERNCTPKSKNFGIKSIKELGQSYDEFLIKYDGAAKAAS